MKYKILLASIALQGCTAFDPVYPNVQEIKDLIPEHKKYTITYYEKKQDFNEARWKYPFRTSKHTGGFIVTRDFVNYEIHLLDKGEWQNLCNERHELSHIVDMNFHGKRKDGSCGIELEN